MLTLLRREQVLTVLQSRLRSYLEGARAGADAFDRAVIDAAVSGIPVADRRRLIERTFAGAAGQQAPDGGWAYAQDVAQTDVDRASHVMILLHTLDAERYRDQIGAARRYLTDLVGDDGGMPTYRLGQPSEPTMTANTIAALAPYHFAHTPLLHAATGFLLRTQKPDGTFERSWSLSESNAMMRAHAALARAHDHNPAAHAGRLGPAIEAIRARLLATANRDGGWGQTPGAGSDPMSTAYTLTTLAATQPHHPTFTAGLRHLLERQDADGGYRSISDQAAPRPLRYSVLVLTDIFVLLALTHVS